tara:strand:+ start:5554 stop:6711 length:1158 start_codon:yes stop_codon:yes gene_type:complete
MIPLFKVYMDITASYEVSKTLESGFITQGPKVEQFETELKKFFDCKYLLTLNSATSGLNLALKLLFQDVPELEWKAFDKQNDIVLTPALTCFATTASILSHDVKIRWLDVDPSTCGIDLDDLQSKLNDRTKVIYVVHWGGTPCDFEKLDLILDSHKQKYGFRPMIVEDCAHAFGAEYKPNVKVGNHSRNICVFSLQAIKHITTGDGGIITVPSENLYNRAKLLRWYGIDRDKRNYNNKDFRLENDIIESGYKYHMNDISATIGLCNLKRIDYILERNNYNANYFDKYIKNTNVTFLKNPVGTKSAYWLYTILVENKEDFIQKMKECKIMVSQVHNRNDIFTCVEQYKESLKNLDQLEKQMVCIPVGWWLTEQQLNYIVSCINDGW